MNMGEEDIIKTIRRLLDAYERADFVSSKSPVADAVVRLAGLLSLRAVGR